MTTRFFLLGVLIAAAPVAAQQPLPEQQRWTLGLNVGGSSAGSDLASTSDWKTGLSGGANMLYRVAPKFGVRADANFAKNDLSQTGTTSTTTTYDKMSYMGNAIWAFKGSANKVAPYLLGGLGAVNVKDKATSQSFTELGTNLGLGADYKLGKVGLKAEGRDLIYKFNHFGYDKTQNDFLWQGGVTIPL